MQRLVRHNVPAALLTLMVTVTVHSGCFASSPSEMDLYPTKGAMDTVITMSGADFITASTIYCRIGKRMVLAQQNVNATGYESIILCKAPQQSAGFHSVEITHNGRDFTNSGLMFHYVDNFISKVFPEHVDRTGGTTVMVQGRGFQNGCYCNSGGNAVEAAFASSALLTCEVLAALDEKDSASPLSISAAHTRHHVHSQPYNLQLTDHLRVKGVRAGADGIQAEELIIEGNGFNTRVQQIWCKIGSISVLGQIFSSTRCICIPPYLRARMYSLQISHNQVDFTTAVDDAVYRRPCMYGEGPVPLAFRSDGQVSLLSSYAKTTCSVGESTEVMKVPARPSETLTEFRCSVATLHHAFETVEISGSAWCAGKKHVVEVRDEPASLLVYSAFAIKIGGSLHSVFGRDFTRQTMCKFDDSLSHGEQISSVLAICEAPGEERRAISNTFLHFTLASNSLFLSVQTLFRSVQTLFVVGKRTLREESNFREASSLLQIGGFPGQTKFTDIGSNLDLVNLPVIRNASSTLGSIDGGSSLQFAAEFNIRAQIFACQVSSISKIAARWLSSDKIECITPARKSGQANIFISTGPFLEAWRIPFTYNGDQHHVEYAKHSQKEMSTYGNTDLGDGVSTRAMEQNVQPKITSFFPSIVGATGGVVTVFGDGFSQGSCSHHDISTCCLVSSALIRMEVNGGASGEYFVPFALVSTSSTQAVRLMYENEATATSVRPAHGTVDGGTVMLIAGESFTNSLRLSCNIGTATPVSGRWIDSRMIECISPAHEKGFVAVGAMNGYPGLDRATVMFRYRASDVVGTYPFHGYRSEVATRGQQMSDGSHRELTLSDMPQVARMMGGVSLTDVGFVAAAVGGSGHGAHLNVQFQTDSGAFVRSIIPMHIESGAHHPVKILGKEFSADASFCMVGENMLDALILSSAVAICELPDHADGDVNVAIGRNIGSGNVGMVTFFRQTRVVEVIPSSGPEAGGTLVVVKTLADRQSPSHCRFGSTGPVATRASSAAAYQCTSPSHLAATSSFRTQMLHSPFSDDHSLSFFAFLRVSPYLTSLPQMLPLNGGSVRLFSHDRCTSVAPSCGIFSLRHDCFLDTTLHSLRSSGFQTVKLCNYFSVDLYFLQLSSIEHIFPRVVTPDSPHPYTVYGHDFFDDNSRILIGTVEVPCQFRSSCMLTCTSIHNVDSQGGILHRSSLDQPELSVDTFAIKMHSIKQSSGDSVGGTVISIYGTFHAENPMTTCRVGSIAPIAASYVDGDTVQCVAPAHTIDVVDISVGFHGDGYVPESQEYAYIPTCLLQAVIPSKGSTRGDFDVALHQANCGSKDFLCQAVENTHTLGNIRTNTLVCMMAASVPGFVAWEIVHGVDVDSENTVFEYVHPSSLKSLQPNYLSPRGGALVTLSGVNFKDGLGCAFDDNLVSGVFVSSGIFICEAPALGLQLITSAVSVSFVGNAIMRDVLELSLISPPAVDSILPDKGSSEGGTMIVVVTQNEPVNLGLSISVGNIRPIAFRTLSGNNLDYVSPAHRPGQTQVKMSLSGDQSDAGRVFEHVAFGQLCACSRNCAHTWEAIDALLQSENSMMTTTGCMFGSHCSGFDGGDAEDCSAYHSPYDFVEGRTVTWSTSGNTDLGDGVSTRAMEQNVQPKITSFFPSIVGATGGVVTVFGDGFSQGSCSHHDISTCCLVSSALIRMEVNGGASGEYFVPFALVSTSSTQAVRLMYENEATATSVRPAHGTVDGGTVMLITGESFTNSLRLSCNIGTATPVSGRWIDSRMIECISPAHEKGFVAVGAMNGYPGLDRATVMFRYRASDVVGTYPFHGYRSEVATRGQQMSDGSHRELTLSDMPQVARMMGGVSLTDVGFVAAAVGGSGHGAHLNVQFQTDSGAFVRSIIPMHIESGAHHPVKILGKEFSADASFCMVGENMLDALILSSAVAICELPDHADGDVNVAIGRNIGSGNVGMVTFFRQTRVVEVIPSSGPEAGGTLVVVKTLADRQSPSHCRFGSTGPVATRASSAAAYQCTSPSHSAMHVPLRLSISLSGFGTHALFSFHGASLLLGDISPRTSHVSTCSPIDVGTDNVPRSTNALFYNDHRKTLCKSRAAASGFMAVFLIGATNSYPSVQFTTLDFPVFRAPFVHSMHPALGIAEGGTLTQVIGENMVGNEWNQLNCIFGNETQKAYTVSSSISVCEVPAETHLTSGFVSVGLSHELPSSIVGVEEPAQYVYVDSPTLEYITPERGPERGGTALHVHGRRFSNTQDLSCKFGNMHVRATFVSDQEILCLTPSHAHGGVAVHVATNGRDFTMNALQFSFLS